MAMKKLALTAAVAALFVMPIAAHAQQSAGTLVNDSAITAQIKAAQAGDSTVRATRINVETDNAGVVTLSGNARSQAEIDRAVELAKGVKGVTSVINNMTLAAAGGDTAATTPSTSTSAGSMSTDTRPMPTPRADRN